MRIEQLKSIDGIASDIRQARATIISSSGYEASWGTSYECLFRLSGTPVVLRLSNPIFIENGETVRIVGRHNQNGVFEALAYHNRSSGASGITAYRTVSMLFAMGMTIIGGIATFFGWGLLNRVDFIELIIGFVIGLVGPALVLVCWINFFRSRTEIHTIERLLNDP
jgi:hypothetical protein